MKELYIKIEQCDVVTQDAQEFAEYLAIRDEYTKRVRLLIKRGLSTPDAERFYLERALTGLSV